MATSAASSICRQARNSLLAQFVHDDQVPIDDALAAELIRSQFPQWGSEPIERLPTSATTSYIYRIGRSYTARFPMRHRAAELVNEELISERAAMEEFRTTSPIASPAMVGIGKPGDGFPMPWSVQTWLDGDVAGPETIAASGHAVRDVVDLIGSLRGSSTQGRHFSGSGRGGQLTSHEEWVEHCLHQSTELLPVARLEVAWRELRETPRPRNDVMSHGDLIPANLLVESGRIVGVLDTGGYGAADPALDLVCAWHLFDLTRRKALRAALSSDDVEWRRGAAWALIQALGLVWYYEESNPAMAHLGRSTLGRILSDPELGF